MEKEWPRLGNPMSNRDHACFLILLAAWRRGGQRDIFVVYALAIIRHLNALEVASLDFDGNLTAPASINFPLIMTTLLGRSMTSPASDWLGISGSSIILTSFSPYLFCYLL